MAKEVNLGSHGSFKIKHPGVFRAKAQAAGMSTAAFASKEKGASGATGRQARAAIGLMHMGGKSKKSKPRTSPSPAHSFGGGPFKE